MNSDIEMISLLNQITRRFWKILSPYIRKADLTPTDMFLLMILKKRKSCLVSELADKIGIPASTCTGILDRLEKQGLLVRIHNPQDRRSLLVQPTKNLPTLMKKWKDPADNAIHEIFSDFPEKRMEKLVSELKEVLSLIDKYDVDPNSKEMREGKK